MIKKLIKKILVWIPGHRFLFDRLPTASRCIALTFDDGPEPEVTYKILESLRSYKAKATFFLIGSKAERYPQCVSDIEREGHEIAIHSYAHQSYAKMSLREIRDDIFRCETIHSRHKHNCEASLIRPPYGDLSLKLFLYILLYRRRLAMWTLDSNDSFVTSPEELIENVRSQDIRSGEILLFHDDYEKTAVALPKILQRLNEGGFCFCTLGNMISSRAGLENPSPIDAKLRTNTRL